MNVLHLEAHIDYKPNSEHALPAEDENPDGFWLSFMDPFCTRLTQERFFKVFSLGPLDPRPLESY